MKRTYPRLKCKYQKKKTTRCSHSRPLASWSKLTLTAVTITQHQVRWTCREWSPSLAARWTTLKYHVDLKTWEAAAANMETWRTLIWIRAAQNNENALRLHKEQPPPAGPTQLPPPTHHYMQLQHWSRKPPEDPQVPRIRTATLDHDRLPSTLSGRQCKE